MSAEQYQSIIEHAHEHEHTSTTLTAAAARSIELKQNE